MESSFIKEALIQHFFTEMALPILIILSKSLDMIQIYLERQMKAALNIFGIV
uniref:Uncharacterized protein n=1 Tax=viral metagenome TaxID=1070528 RepID=A0A6C0DBV6_9ZZZZ